MNRTPKKIWLPYGASKKMMKAFGVPRTTFHSAITFASNSDQAKAIRAHAVKFYGGVEIY